MAKWSDLNSKAQLGVILGLAAAITLGLYFMVYKTIDDGNRRDLQTLAQKKADLEQLRPYENKLVDLNMQIESLKQQLEIQKRIVPDEKEAENFIVMMQREAVASGIEVRRYTTRPPAAHEFYTEVPYEVEIDGPYFGVLNFYERISKLERIINVSNLLMATTRKPQPAKAKKSYAYAPGESVVATCVATTFFSHDPQPAAPVADTGKKRGATPAAAPAKKK
jgi:type IV pilus assembly protein PilO